MPPSLALVPPIRPAADVAPPDSPLRRALGRGDWTAAVVESLVAMVGGVDALEQLDTSPLVDTPFDWASVDGVDADVVRRVLHEVEQRTPQWLLDAEQRVIVRRLVQRVLLNRPKVLHRGELVRTAAAFVWLALRGNGDIARGGLRADIVWQSFGVGSCADRGRTLFAACGLPRATPSSGYVVPDQNAVWLADPQLLHGRARANLLRRRTQVEQLVRDADARQVAARRPPPGIGGRVSVAALWETPRWAMRMVTDAGRAMVLVGLGDQFDGLGYLDDLDDLDDPGVDRDDGGLDEEVLAFSVPDARHLVMLLQEALDGPLDQSNQCPPG